MSTRATWHKREVYGTIDVSRDRDTYMWTDSSGKGIGRAGVHRIRSTIPGTISLPDGHYKLVRVKASS